MSIALPVFGEFGLLEVFADLLLGDAVEDGGGQS
jgi:hypothetical protein